MSTIDTMADQPLLPMPLSGIPDHLWLSSRGWSSIESWKAKWAVCKTRNIVISFTVILAMTISCAGFITRLSSDRQNHTSRTKLGASPEADRSIVDPSALPNCSKTLLYHFVNPNGLGSELGLYSMAALTASTFNYTILIDDSAWIYGRLADYFDMPPLLCRPPPKETPRTLFKNVGLDQPDHVYANWSDTGRAGFTKYILGQVDRRAVDVNSAWNLINHREQRTVLPATQNLHYSMKTIFDAKSEALRHIWRPNKKILDQIRSMKEEFNHKMIDTTTSTNQKSTSISYTLNSSLESPMRRKIISVHFRLGDKKQENSSWKPVAEVGITSSFANPKPFFDAVRSYVPNWKTSENLPAVFVFSDDAKTAMSILEDHQSFYQSSQRFPLLSSPTSSKIYKDGHDQYAFVRASLEVRRELTLALIRDMTFAVDNSEGIVCSSSSNICNLLFLLRGSQDAIGPQATTRSVDLRWHPTALSKEFSNMSLDRVKDRAKILKMIPILAAEEKNYIDT